MYFICLPYLIGWVGYGFGYVRFIWVELSWIFFRSVIYLSVY